MILCTLDIKSARIRAAKTAFIYLLISLFCVLFGAIYEVFSHGVYSFYMIYAFVFPLAGGTLPFSVIGVSNRLGYPDAFTGNLYHSGIAAWTVGSIIRGVLDIYGTTNALCSYYFMVGGAFVGVAVILYVGRHLRLPCK